MVFCNSILRVLRASSVYSVFQNPRDNEAPLWVESRQTFLEHEVHEEQNQEHKDMQFNRAPFVLFLPPFVVFVSEPTARTKPHREGSCAGY